MIHIYFGNGYRQGRVRLNSLGHPRWLLMKYQSHLRENCSFQRYPRRDLLFPSYRHLGVRLLMKYPCDSREKCSF